MRFVSGASAITWNGSGASGVSKSSSSTLRGVTAVDAEVDPARPAGWRPAGSAILGGLRSGAIADAQSSAMLTGGTFQMRSQYSRIDRSEENLPERAVFRIDMRVQRA